MGTRGPKALPDNVHRLKGNPSKKNLGVNTGSDVPVEVPPKPESIAKDPVASQQWDESSAELYRLGLVAKVDGPMLEIFCNAVSLYRKASLKIIELDEKALVQSSVNGYQQKGVWLQIQDGAADKIKTFGREFGMSPSARVTVNPSPQMGLFPEEETPDNGSGSKRNGKKRKAKAAAPEDYFTS